MYLKYKLLSAIVITLGISTGCKKFVQVPPPVTSISGTTVYSNNSTAAAAMTSVYDNMVSGSTYLSSGYRSIGYFCGLSADELANYSTNSLYVSFYTNQLIAENFNSFWQEIYNKIYTCNSVIEGLAASNAVNTSVKQQLIGEAEFMRAFFHFYAVNLFGDVPLVLTTNYAANQVAKRTPAADVYQQIITDLKDAQAALSTNYLEGDAETIGGDRVRPTKWAAAALLARVYLYTNDWIDAEAEADTVINNTNLFALNPDLNAVFLINSSEAIWQLQSVFPGINTWDGYFYVLTSPPGRGNFYVALSSNLSSAFETGDGRFTNWLGTYTANSVQYYYPYKYKAHLYNKSAPLTEYTMILRLAEQYLIRAEARAQQGNISGSQSDLNIIRQRAGLSNTTASDQSSLLSAILHERQVELFTEWGNRWFDLKRTGNINSVMSIVAPQKGGTWSSYKALFPIPLSEIQLNSNLTQNPGYN